jgi:hypothetical protein
MFADPLTERLATFVRAIGIDVAATPLSGLTFLPGLDIHGGALRIDEARPAAMSACRCCNITAWRSSRAAKASGNTKPTLTCRAGCADGARARGADHEP